MRSAVNPILMSPKNVNVYFQKVLNSTNEFVERIKEIRDSETFEVHDNFLSEINRLTFENVVSIALDKELGLIRKNRDDPEAVKVFELVSRVFKLIYEVDVKPPLWKIIPTSAFKEMMSSLNDIHVFIENCVNEFTETKRYGDENESVVQKLINVDKKLAVVVAFDMILAGVDTVSVLKAFFVKFVRVFPPL